MIPHFDPAIKKYCFGCQITLEVLKVFTWWGCRWANSVQLDRSPEQSHSWHINKRPKSHSWHPNEQSHIPDTQTNKVTFLTHKLTKSHFWHLNKQSHIPVKQTNKVTFRSHKQTKSHSWHSNKQSHIPDTQTNKVTFFTHAQTNKITFLTKYL